MAEHAQRLLLVAPQAQLGDLDALLQAWRARGIDVAVDSYQQAMPIADTLLDGHDAIEALLLAGDARRAPATVLPGPFLMARDGRRVPAAWLPLRNSAANQRFAACAARVQRRTASEQSLALFSQWHPQYLRVIERIDSLVRAQWQTFRWSGDLITREGLVDAVGSGLGLGVYLGHGRAVGWVGYHGVRSHHFDAFDGEPMGALMSLCCRTASRRRTGLSYAEALPLRGVAAASFGATSDTLHTDNTRWAIGLCDALSAGVKTIGELVARAAPASPSACKAYRLIGDPLAPLASSRAAVMDALAVPTYP